MRHFILFFFLLLQFTSNGQSSKECISLEDLLKLTKLRESSKIEGLIASKGYSLSNDNGKQMIFSGVTMSLVTVTVADSGMSKVEFNMEAQECFKAIESALEKAGFIIDYSWSAGMANATGYESADKGVLMFTSKKFTEVDGNRVEGQTFICTIMNKNIYSVRKSGYKENPKITVQEF